jgi:muramoyltetrapeptide carboxypeptidase
LHSLKPKKISPGDTIGVIAPASPGDMQSAQAGISWLEAQGFHVRTGATLDQTWGYLAGSDDLRAADINAMFADSAVNGIICLRGGYGTMRLLDLVDYALIRDHPKVFVGYSDITALHLSIGQRTGLVTFHGPMVASDMGRDIPLYTQDYFFKAVTAASPIGAIINPPLTPPPIFIASGTAHGILTGGNLSLIAATLGTPYEIDTRGKLLCLEEVGEAPYRLDRMLTQLLLAGKLQQAAGIVVDVCPGCTPDEESADFTVAQVLEDRLGTLGKPVLYYLHFGHTPDKATLPLGVTATLCSERGGLTITEAATID